MSDLSQISSLKQLNAERQELRKEAGKRERIVMRDLAGIQESWATWTNNVFRLKNILSIFIPKIEFATLLFPIIRRLFGWKKKK